MVAFLSYVLNKAGLGGKTLNIYVDTKIEYYERLILAQAQKYTKH